MTPEQVEQRIQTLIGAAPATLDTLAEIAEALGNNPNFAATITEQLGTKATNNPRAALEADLSAALTALTDAFTQGAATFQNATLETP